MCAIEAGKRGRRVLVIERNQQPGRKILISGGGARSALWRQMIADVLGTNLVTVRAAEGAEARAGALPAPQPMPVRPLWRPVAGCSRSILRTVQSNPRST